MQYLIDIYEGCRVLSSLGLGFVQQSCQDKYSINGAPPPPKAELLLANHSLPLSYVGHSLAHPYSYKPQDVRGYS